VPGSCRFDTDSTTTRTGQASASDANPSVLAQCRLRGTTSSFIRDVSSGIRGRVHMHPSGRRSTSASILHRFGRVVPRRWPPRQSGSGHLRPRRPRRKSHSVSTIYSYTYKTNYTRAETRGEAVLASYTSPRIEVRPKRYILNHPGLHQPGRAGGDPGEHVSDPVHASSRPVRGLLSIVRLTRHHAVLGPSPNPRGVTLSRPVYRKTDAPLTRSAAQR
jgi:hypothetical protein